MNHSGGYPLQAATFLIGVCLLTVACDSVGSSTDPNTVSRLSTPSIYPKPLTETQRVINKNKRELEYRTANDHPDHDIICQHDDNVEKYALISYCEGFHKYNSADFIGILYVFPYGERPAFYMVSTAGRQMIKCLTPVDAEITEDNTLDYCDLDFATIHEIEQAITVLRMTWKRYISE